MKNEVLQILNIDSLLSETGTLIDPKDYLLIGNPQVGLDESCILRKDFPTKQEAIAASKSLTVKYKTRSAKFEKCEPKYTENPCKLFDPQSNEVQEVNENGQCVVEWTFANFISK